MSSQIRPRDIHLHLAKFIDIGKADPASIIIAGCILYFIGCVGLFSTWKMHQVIDTAAAVISGFGLLDLCMGILLIDDYLSFKFFALISSTPGFKDSWLAVCGANMIRFLKVKSGWNSFFYIVYCYYFDLPYMH